MAYADRHFKRCNPSGRRAFTHKARPSRTKRIIEGLQRDFAITKLKVGVLKRACRSFYWRTCFCVVITKKYCDANWGVIFVCLLWCGVMIDVYYATVMIDWCLLCYCDDWLMFMYTTVAYLYNLCKLAVLIMNYMCFIINNSKSGLLLAP